MYEYEFMRVNFGLLGKPDIDYPALARQKGAEGWRLMHIVTMEGSMWLELVFERPLRGPQDSLRADGPDELEPTYQAPPLSRG